MIHRGWRVLVVSAEQRVFELLKTPLEPEDYQLGWALDPATAWLTLMGEPAPELVLLDAGLFDQAAWRLCRRMRAAAITCPVLVVMRQNDPYLRASALDAGADDCLLLPFARVELLARLRALLRRRWPLAEPDADQLLELDNLSFNCTRQELWRGDQLVPLTPMEAQIVQRLLLRPGVVIWGDELGDALWGAEGRHRADLLEVYAESLLQKLNDGASLPRLHRVEGAPGAAPGLVLREC